MCSIRTDHHIINIAWIALGYTFGSYLFNASIMIKSLTRSIQFEWPTREVNLMYMCMFNVTVRHCYWPTTGSSDDDDGNSQKKNVPFHIYYIYIWASVFWCWVCEWAIGKWIMCNFNTNHFITVIGDNGKRKNGHLIHIRWMVYEHESRNAFFLLIRHRNCRVSFGTSFTWPWFHRSWPNAKISQNARTHWISFGATLRYAFDKLSFT